MTISKYPRLLGSFGILKIILPGNSKGSKLDNLVIIANEITNKKYKLRTISKLPALLTYVCMF